MLETYIRPAYQQVLVDPIAKLMSINPRISANAVSIMSGVLGLIVLAVLALGDPFVACGILWLSGYLDTLDGTLARMTETSSPKGTVLDIFCDRIVETSVFLGLFLVDPSHRGLWVILMLIVTLLCITSFLVVGIFSENESHKSFHYSPGLVERVEAFFFFSAMMVLPEFFVPLAIAYTLLVLWTALFRIYQFMKQA